MSAAFVRWIRFSAAFGLMGCSAGLAWGADEAPVNARIVIRGGGQAIRIVEEEAQPSPWWIGLMCEPVTDAQRANLALGAMGLQVRHVLPNSPAAAAGLKDDDIILSANTVPVGDIASLVRIVTEADGKVVKLAVLRDGNREAIAVTPARRPAELSGVGPRLVLLEQEAPETSSAAIPTEGGLVLVSPPAAQSPGVTLPDDMQVVIRKEGSAPARVKVTQGNKSWKTVEGELDMLPPAALPYVRRALGLASAPATSEASGMPLQFRLQLNGDNLQFGNQTAGQRAAAKVQSEGVIIRLGEGDNSKPETKIEKTPESKAAMRESGESRVRWRAIERPETEKLERAAEKLRDLKAQLDKEREELRLRGRPTPPTETSVEVSDELRGLQEQLQLLRKELSRLRKEIDEQN